MRVGWLLAVFVLWGCSVAPKGPPAEPETLSCKTDADCVLFGYDGEDCCGPLCATDDVTTAAHANAHKAWRDAHCPTDSACPVPECEEVGVGSVEHRPACIGGTCQVEVSYHGLAKKAAVAHLCAVLSKRPQEVADAPAEKKQEVLMSVLEATAKEAGVEGWSVFQGELEKKPVEERQAWLNMSVEKNGLREACAVLYAEVAPPAAP